MERIAPSTDFAKMVELYQASSPIPGRPGWRRDGEGREWYSASWIDCHYEPCSCEWGTKREEGREPWYGIVQIDNACSQHGARRRAALSEEQPCRS